jgi:bride of sevenless protein
MGECWKRVAKDRVLTCFFDSSYLQSVLCLFSVLVQVGLSTQLLIMMQTNIKNLSCQSIYYGNWFWSLVAYDGLLLTVLIFLSPFIFRSKRNYQEGILLVVAAILCLVVWTVWIPLSMVSSYWRDLAVPFGMQGTAWAILVGILLPRCFLIIRGIARSEFAQALPSLTSLAFASQQNQYMSDQVSCGVAIILSLHVLIL